MPETKREALDRPNIFTIEKEDTFLAICVAVRTSEFPTTAYDLKFLARYYIDSAVKTAEYFKYNFLTVDWLNSFVSRNSLLTQRMPQNILQVRTSTDEQIICYLLNILQLDLS